MEAAAGRTILRIELYHIGLLLALLVFLGPMKLVDPAGLLAGGLFMALNFLLLSLGVAWVLTPLAGKGRVKLGVGLLILKVAVFLALLSTVFFRFELDAVSFALGFSALIPAIVFESVRRALTIAA
jgi:hypothetical protein